MQCFVRVASLKKTRADVKTYIYFCIKISSKIDQKSTKKSRTTAFATKPVKRRSLEHPFSPKIDFWSIWGSQRRPQNWQKWVRDIDPRGLGSHLVATLGDLEYFFPFWVDIWSIWDTPRPHFGSILIVFVGCCLLCYF